MKKKMTDSELRNSGTGKGLNEDGLNKRRGAPYIPKRLASHYVPLNDGWECCYCPAVFKTASRPFMELHTAKHFSTYQFRG